MVVFLLTCITPSTGFPSGIASCIGFALLSGNVSWVQLLAIYALSLLYLLLSQVAQPSVPLLGVTFWSLLPALLLSSAEHSLSLVQQRGMTYHPSFAYPLVLILLPSMHS